MSFDRNGDTILFTHEGGVDVGDVDAKALKLDLEIDESPSLPNIKAKLLVNVDKVVVVVVSLICILRYLDKRSSYVQTSTRLLLFPGLYRSVMRAQAF